MLPLVSFIFLSLENYGVRKLEAVFALLITTMAVSFAWMFTDTKPNGKDLLIGKDLTDLFLCCNLTCVSLSTDHTICNFRYFGSKIELKDNKASGWGCWLCNHAPQCVSSFSTSAVKENRSK